MWSHEWITGTIWQKERDCIQYDAAAAYVSHIIPMPKQYMTERATPDKIQTPDMCKKQIADFCLWAKLQNMARFPGYETDSR